VCAEGCLSMILDETETEIERETETERETGDDADVNYDTDTSSVHDDKNNNRVFSSQESHNSLRSRLPSLLDMTKEEKHPSRSRRLQSTYYYSSSASSSSEMWLMSVNVTVTFNTVDFLDPQNITAILSELEVSVVSLPYSDAFMTLFGTLLFPYYWWFTISSHVFSPSITLLSITPAPFLLHTEEFEPTLIPTLTPSSLNTEQQQEYTTTDPNLNRMEIIGLSISLFALLFFQIGILYLCCQHRIRKILTSSSAISSLVGVDNNSAPHRWKWVSNYHCMKNHSAIAPQP
jgi:hypothetical protein